MNLENVKWSAKSIVSEISETDLILSLVNGKNALISIQAIRERLSIFPVKVTNISHTDSPYDVLLADFFINVDCSAGNVLVNLPLGTDFWGFDIGRVLKISDKKCVSGGTYKITVNAREGDTITSSTTGNASHDINSNGAVRNYQLVSNNEWKVD